MTDRPSRRTVPAWASSRRASLAAVGRLPTCLPGSTSARTSRSSPPPDTRVEVDDWRFTITTETGAVHEWDWSAFRALATESPTVDLHCVTRWSKLATSWEGVSLDTLLAEVETGADYASVDSYGGYITNLRWRTCSTARGVGCLPVR